jgi:hypothetical protein
MSSRSFRTGFAGAQRALRRTLCLVVALLGAGCRPGMATQPHEPSPSPEAPEGLEFTTVNPRIWPSAGGALMELRGRGFQEGARVSIAGMPVPDPLLIEPTRIQLTIPPRPGSLGAVPIRVSNPDGSSITRGDLFSLSASRVDFFGGPIATGSAPSAVSIADLNQDGILDVVVANSGDDTISVLLGLGGGEFAAGRQLPTGRQPRALALMDLNDDGRLDVLAACSGSDALSVLLGDGRGGFGPSQLHPAGTAPSALAVADYDGDGALDVVLSSPGSDGIELLLGDGRGSFGAPRGSRVTGSPIAVVTADWNGDGKPDLATANPAANSVTVLLGDGAGAFAAPQSFAVETGPRALAAKDVNGDGRTDLVVANTGTRTMSFLAGDGTGRFAPARSISLGVALYPNHVLIADLTRDGIPDLLVCRPGDGFAPQDVIVVSGDGTGAFSGASPYVAGATPAAADIGDA